MALDGIFLRHIKNEIEKEAIGARVNQIYQPNRDGNVTFHPARLYINRFAGKLGITAQLNSR